MAARSASGALDASFFASARVRRECGGYPLSDGPYHRWFVLRRQDGCLRRFSRAGIPASGQMARG